MGGRPTPSIREVGRVKNQLPSNSRSRPRLDHGKLRQRDMSSPLTEWSVQVDAHDQGERIDRLLARRLSLRSRTELQALVEQGRVVSYDNWQRSGYPTTRLRSSHRVSAGQLVILTLDADLAEGDDSAPAATLAEERVLYEDDHLIAIDKPAGYSVHPSRRHLQRSLIELLHRRQHKVGQPSLPSPCHRLDRETSGIVLFAKTRQTRSALGRLFESRRPTQGRRYAEESHYEISKVYHAVVSGCPSTREQSISLALGPDSSSAVPIRQRVLDNPGYDNAKSAVTQWQLLQANPRLQRSLVELRPLTGRQHQLRVHSAAIGFPILGDALYLGDDQLFLRARSGQSTRQDALRLQSPRLALHATRLSFIHPVTRNPTTIESSIPQQISDLLSPRLSGCSALG